MFLRQMIEKGYVKTRVKLVIAFSDAEVPIPSGIVILARSKFHVEWIMPNMFSITQL